MDPALLVLLAGVGAAVLQLVRSVLPGFIGSSVKLAEGLNGLRVVDGRVVGGNGRWCYAAVLVEELRCVYDARELFETVLERVLALDKVVGVVVGKQSIDRSRLLADIENRIMSLRVVLEKEPGNKIVERKLSLLEKMHNILASGRAAAAVGILLVLRDSCDNIDGLAENLASEVSKTGCRARVVRGEKLLNAIGMAFGVRYSSLDSVTPVRIASSIVLGVAEGQGGFGSRGVYVGRSRRGTPYILPLSGKQGSLHYVILGPTGRGKTTLASILLLRAEALGYHVYGVDPKGDMAARLKGLLDRYEVRLRDAVHAAFWLYREGVLGRRVIEELLVELGLEASLDVRTVSGTCIFDTIGVRDGRLVKLGLRGLNICVKPSWVRRNTVFDVSSLPESLRTAAMVAIAYLALHVGGSLLVIDEAWRLGKMASFHLIRLYKEARSRGLSLVSVTQDPRDLPDEIYNNSYGVILFGSNDERYIREAVLRLGLGEYEERILRVLGVGEVLVRLSSSRPEVVEVDASELLGG